MQIGVQGVPPNKSLLRLPASSSWFARKSCVKAITSEHPAGSSQSRHGVYAPHYLQCPWKQCERPPWVAKMATRWFAKCTTARRWREWPQLLWAILRCFISSSCADVCANICAYGLQDGPGGAGRIIRLLAAIFANTHIWRHPWHSQTRYSTTGVSFLIAALASLFIRTLLLASHPHLISLLMIFPTLLEWSNCVFGRR